MCFCHDLGEFLFERECVLDLLLLSAGCCYERVNAVVRVNWPIDRAMTQNFFQARLTPSAST